jgi:hypothetical protein
VSDWGPPCQQCGHPASFHGATFCMCDAGAETKRLCDCTGYNKTRLYVSYGALVEHFQATHPTVSLHRCLEAMQSDKPEAVA